MAFTMTHSEDGFSLVETLVATSILVTALAGVAQLFLYSVRFTREMGVRDTAVLAAQSKLEWLTARAFGYGPDGDEVTDPALAPSPPDALIEDTPGYVDLLDVDGDPAAQGGGRLVRRWTITPWEGGSPNVLALEVCVFRAPAAAVPREAAEACLATVRARQP